MKFGKCELAIRKRPLENGSFREVIVIDGLIRIITIIRLFVNGNSDFKNLYREGGKRFVDIKERMAKEDAIYGGEMSAHHYFRDFSYCDSGMLPWLLIAELLSSTGKSLGQFVKDAEAKFPISGEINSEVADANAAVQCVYEAYKDKAEGEDRTDGISLSFGNWRFNLRCSNTEPVVRLNVESKGDKALVDEKTKEIFAILRK